MFRGFFKEFTAFIKKGSAIDMAVGIIVGTVMTGVVNSLVKDIIMPPIGLLIGGVDFSQLFIVISGGAEGVVYRTVAAAQEAGATTLNVGLFLNTLVSFAITMFAIFLFVKAANKIRGEKPVTTRACPYCKSAVDIAAVKCPFCCSELIPEKPKEIIKNGEDAVSKITSKIKKIIK